jgi:hypothetical protein
MQVGPTSVVEVGGSSLFIAPRAAKQYDETVEDIPPNR